MATFNHIKQNGQRKGYSVSLVGRFAFIAVMLFSYGCMKEEIFSVIPQITYISHSLEKNHDSMGVLWNCTVKFELKDGDGDVGLPSPDSTTLPEYRYNLFFTQFNKKNGTFVEVPANPLIPFSYTILPFEAEGNNKSQKATISVEVMYRKYPADTIMLRFYVKDRALNSSNTLETDEIIFNPLQK